MIRYFQKYRIFIIVVFLSNFTSLTKAGIFAVTFVIQFDRFRYAFFKKL